MATCLYVDGIRFPDGTCQRTQGVASGGMFQQFNCCVVCNGPHTCRAHCGRCGSWSAPTCASEITFEVWSGGGSGAGHCCQGCWCDMASCGAYAGYYGRKTIRRIDGQFVPGCSYGWCMGAGGNGTTNNGCGCFTVCCDAPRGCASWVQGSGLCCTCMTGGRGGYNIYCVCYCINQGNRVDGMCNNGLCIGCKWDFVDLGNESYFNRFRSNVNCNSRSSATSESWGIKNRHEYSMQTGTKYCGCTNCCRGFRQIAKAGSNNIKATCGQDLSHCNGTPGNPGLIRITWR